MSLIAEVPSGRYSLCPAGQYQVVCTEVVDLGFVRKTYRADDGTDETRNVHEIQYVFQVNKVDAETGKRYTVRSKPFNLSLGQKTNLRAFLLQWRGFDLTADEQRIGFNVEEMVGQNALLQVIHTTVGERTYANIGGIMPLMDGIPPITALDYEPQAASILEARAKAAAERAGSEAPAYTGLAPNLRQPSTVVEAMPHIAPPPQTANGQVHSDGCQCGTCDIPF